MARPASPNRRGRSWLPDADLDAHPVGTWLLEMGFDLWIRAFYRREILRPEGFRVESGTLIASNHQRDVDGPLLGTVLVGRRGLRFQWPLPFYATREDLFRPGILARLTVHWPRQLSAMLGRISLAWFFPLGRAEPMRRIREYTLGETLRSLCDAGQGDAPCGVLLNRRGRRELGVADDVPLRNAWAHADHAVLETWWGLRRLTPTAIASVAPAFRATIATQLQHFAMRLDRGRCVYFSPEGSISMDGRFGRIRGGFFKLAHLARPAPWIQPMVISYDSLAPGRSRVLVRIGQPFRADASLDRRAFDATLRHAILALAPINPSHLLARWLLHGPSTFSRDELAAWLARCLALLRTNGVSLDPAWTRTPLPELARRRLRWLLRKGLVAREGSRFRNTCPHAAEPGWFEPAGVVRYLDNNLTDLVPEAERWLSC